MTQDSSAHTVWPELKYSCSSLEGVSANAINVLIYLTIGNIKLFNSLSLTLT